MSKLIKNLITKDLQARFADVNSAIWLELLGIDGTTTNAFRQDLHEKQMHLEVVKNALFRRAVGAGPLGQLASALQGPAALVTGGETIIDAAKVIEEWRPKLKGMRLRGAVLEGEYLDERAVAGLAKMPTKRDLQARLAAAVRSPGANIASAILSGGRNIAGCLKAKIEKLEKDEGAAQAA
ncbi:MAG: 50S ribosomal protein L10 [Planctomycetota bacterium]